MSARNSLLNFFALTHILPHVCHLCVPLVVDVNLCQGASELLEGLVEEVDVLDDAREEERLALFLAARG